jgi:predicted DCC family thiol-disulfide oxidoreductase YuxK
MRNDEEEGGGIVLFDGVCNLCNRSVSFIIRHDARRRLRFASLQSEFGRRVVAEHGGEQGDLDSILLLQGGKLYDLSTAALRIAAGLTAPWPALALFLVVPRPLRDLVYRVIARNRYRWFGRREACSVPTPETQSRFITGGPTDNAAV